MTMADDLKVEVANLEKVSAAWLTQISPKLKEAAGAIDELKYTVVQFGPLFLLAWESYSKAAVFIQDRLNEAVPAAEKMGNALHSAAVSFDIQELQNKQNILRLAGEMDKQA
ncbi:hypothetical protein [Nocardia cyriacigeorgica]|uniref:hypothetical protein n=1 Tax=Nocardia cyriacigeorgica TaxID=135487 RepID=UPI0018957D84|nr:hypothetical protein [Nocardia cyriacigeorgica]MBF6437881.1 hypothetical protein [Nocardia cyriacigeorgica]